ncbi:MAG TPA: flavin reductase family protein [Caldilineae bacterium]|nr:flavin reductase family protein [Caldilineae bacterium]
MRQVTPQEALSRKYPEWIVLVVSCAANGQVNVMPAGWSMVCSAKPPLYAVSVSPKRFTHKAILDSRAFVIAAPGPDMGEAVWYTGNHSGYDGDKMPASGLKTRPGTATPVPLIEGAVFNLECRLVQQVETGDHTVFVGEIVAAHVDDSVEGRLMNFGDGIYGLAQLVESTRYEAK